jgi:mannitol-1-/sugar-/sorbitol-6-phosphatase
MSAVGAVAGAAAVLFDLDGTLVDSEPVGPRVFARLWSAHHGSPDDGTTGRFERTWRRLDGAPSLPELLADLLGDGAAAFHSELLARYQQELARAPALPGAHDLLAHLAARGTPTAVVSASPPGQIRTVLDRHWWAPAAVVSCDEIGRHKPDPAGYLAAARHVGAAPSLCVVVEDSTNGIEAGRRADMTTVGVRAGAADPNAACVADHAVDTLYDLIA